MVFGPLRWCHVSGLVPKLGRGVRRGSASARPSSETLPPGEGRGGTAAMRKSKPKGRGIPRPARSRRRRKDGDTPLGAVFQGCGGGPAVPVLLSIFERCSGVSRVREPRAAPQRSEPVRAHRYGPGRPMAEGSHTGSERQGAGHADREDGPGRCGRKPVCRLEAEKRGDTPIGRGRGHDFRSIEVSISTVQMPVAKWNSPYPQANRCSHSNHLRIAAHVQALNECRTRDGY
jgi:hypothetical protein